MWALFTKWCTTIISRTTPAPEDVEYYLCGPPLMLGSALGMLDDLGIEEEMIRFDEF